MNKLTGGVYYDKKMKKFRAQIYFYGRKVRLGSFQNEEEAKREKDKASNQIYNLKNYKSDALSFAIADFTLQFVLKMAKDDKHYQMFYDNFAVPALLFAFLNEPDLTKSSFVRRAIDQIAIDVEKQIFHPVYNPLKNAFQYQEDDMRIFVDFLSGDKIPVIAKRYAYSKSTVARKLNALKREMMTRLS